MKILLINTVPTDKNGITNVLFNYLKAMDTEGLQMDFVSINQPDEYYVREIEKREGQLFVLPRLNGTVSYWKSLCNLIRKNRYNIVHIHGNSHTTVLELTAARAAGCGVRIVHAHTTTCKYVVVHKLLAPMFHTLCTLGIACGESAGKFMFGKRPFTVLNNGVDIDKFTFNQEHRDAIRKKHGWDGCRVLGHVGYFLEVKNQQWIIEILRELLNNDDTYRLVLIGNGKLREQVTSKAREYGILDKVTFTGKIDNVDEYLNAMDLVLMPSLFEGLPLSLIEQQANGLRCVVSDTITTEVDKTGNLTFLSLSASAKEWADEIASIKMISDEKRKEMSELAVQSIVRCGYRIKDEALKLKNIYRDSKLE